LLRKKKCASIALPVSGAFHSRYLTKIKESFKSELEKLDIKSLTGGSIKVPRNLDVQLNRDRDDIIYGLVEQLDHPVMFQQITETLVKNAGVTRFVEVRQFFGTQSLPSFTIVISVVQEGCSR
jgi:[acyl-carrier-protein] S-malonyltransferase